MIIKFQISSGLSVQRMRILTFASTDSTGDNISRLKCAVDHHGEHINHIMRKTINATVHALVVIFYVVSTTCHLSNTVVYGLVCVYRSFQERVFQEKHSSTWVWVLVSGANISKNTNMHVWRCGSWFSQYGDTWGQFCRLVSSSYGLMYGCFDLRGGVYWRTCSLVPSVIWIHEVDLVVEEFCKAEVVALSGEQFHVYMYIYYYKGTTNKDIGCLNLNTNTAWN